MNNEWFTIEKIDNETYAISEYGHWEKVHSYLLIGQTKACLIDTGLGIGNIKEITTQLTNLPIQVITTHVHWDHIGGHDLFTDIAVHSKDAAWLENGLPFPPEVVRKSLMQEPFTKPAPLGFNIEEYVPLQGKPTLELHDGDKIDLGNRTLQIIHTPGHSPGHICIYEHERGYVYTGDLVYLGTLFAFYPSTDPVAFANSIQKLCHLENVCRVLPGHNKLAVPDDILTFINQAFTELKSKDLLRQGTGLHDFGQVKIKL